MSCCSFVVDSGLAFIFLTTDPLRQHPTNVNLTFDVPVIRKHSIEIKGQIQQTVRVCLAGGNQFLRAVCVHVFRALGRFRAAAVAAWLRQAGLFQEDF